MRPLVKSAVQSSSAHMRKLARDVSNGNEKSQKTSTPSDPISSTRKTEQPRNVTKSNPESVQDRGEDQRKKPSIEFAKASTSMPKSVNDVVRAPPRIKHLPRNAKKIVAASGRGKKSDAVISMAQKAMMEAERENAIQRYRELKERRMKHQRGSDADS